MPKPSTVDVLNTLRNPTKLNILMLLGEHREMTVTQMAKFIKVSRANLYHFVSEMVREGLLLKPESRVKGNYVEKYYRLNEEALNRAFKNENRAGHHARSPTELRDLIRSFCASLSVQFRIYAEQMANADSKVLEAIESADKEKKLVLAFAGMTDEEYAVAITQIQKILKDAAAASTDESGPPRNRLIVVAMPSFGSKGASGETSDRTKG